MEKDKSDSREPIIQEQEQEEEEKQISQHQRASMDNQPAQREQEKEQMDIEQVKEKQQEDIVENQMIQSEEPSKVVSGKEEKAKKKKQKLYLTDFTEFLPQSLNLINKTAFPTKIRLGRRYQANVKFQPEYKKCYRSLKELKVWSGCSNPENRPDDIILDKFKQILGENRTEQQLIQMRCRMQFKHWRQVLDYAARNKNELRKVYLNHCRNKI